MEVRLPVLRAAVAILRAVVVEVALRAVAVLLPVAVVVLPVVVVVGDKNQLIFQILTTSILQFKITHFQILML